MNHVAHAEHHQRLVHQRAQAMETLRSLGESSRPVELDQTVQGRLSRMDAISQQSMAQAGLANLHNEIQRIDAALARMQSGRFGLCCRCGETLDAQRLAADPTVLFCLDCVEEREAEQREASLRATRGR